MVFAQILEKSYISFKVTAGIIPPRPSTICAIQIGQIALWIYKFFQYSVDI